mgnify:CR=1 FL=1
METKVKKFSHKLLALFLAIVMALTCFTGVITASAASKDVQYKDDAVEYNSLAWNMLSDEQIATSLLDTADYYLPNLRDTVEPMLYKMISGNSKGYITLYDVGAGIKINARYNLEQRYIQIYLIFAIEYKLATVSIKLGSVDELIETINSLQAALDGLDGVLGVLDKAGVSFGDVRNLNFRATDGMSRSKNTSCEIVRAVAGLIHDNSDTLFGKILRGEFTLETLNGALPGGSVYGLIGSLLGMDGADVQSNLVYNLVKTLLFNYTEWFTEEEKLAYNGGGTLTLADGTTKEVAAKTFVYDDVLLEKMTVELLDKISVLVTYNDGTSSATRKEAIEKKMSDAGMTYEAAAASLGYDPNLIYSTEKGMENNILLFAYGDEKIQLTANDSLFEFGYQALKMAWNTVLKDTVKLIHVNNDVDRGHGANFDNQFYYWAEKNITWDTTNLESMYSEANVRAWAEAVYSDYKAESADEFLGWVKDTFTYDRTAAADSEGKWSDIDSTTLFGKVRYSPLADYYFDMQTGSINLYFVQTGTPNLDKFFAQDYATYPSMVAAFNDALVAAVNDLFPDRDNIYVNAKGDTERPTMQLTKDKGVTSINDSAVTIITNTLVGNALDMVQYVADTTDQNILKAFYTSGGTDLTEANLEAAMIPMLISCIGNVNLGSGRLDEIIHPADWDACKDAEAVAFVCLREYLSHILPERDYNSLVTVSDGKISATLNRAILPMARDAVTFVMDGYVPVADASGNAWKVEDRPVSDEATLLELLNSVVCYYADFYQNKAYNGRTMGIAALLGVCDANGNSLVTMNNNIWQNFDAVANELFPILGVLQGNGSANFSSEELIWNDLVLGILDIGKTDIHKSNMGGVSNFVYRFLSIVSTDPIQNDSVIDTAYEVLRELVNGLFGGRYANQPESIIPAASGKAKDGARPFDALLQKEVLGGTSSNPGAVPNFFINLTEFTGYKSGIDTVLPGVLYALTAVNSFVNILPDLAEHKLSMASTNLEKDTFTGCTSTEYKTVLKFRNECQGINIAYVDGMNNGKVNQLSRYYVKPVSANITLDGQNNGSSITAPSSNLLAPGESINLDVTTLFDTNTNESRVYEIVITYDVIVKENGSDVTIAEGLKARDYIYLANEVSWAETFYPGDVQEDGCIWMPSELAGAGAGNTRTKNGFKSIATSSYTDGNYIYTTYPEYVVLSTDNLSAVDHYAVRHQNTAGGILNRDRSIDGVYYFDNKTVMNDATGTEVTVNQNNPIPVFDKTTGDLLFIGKYDVSYDGGKTFTERGKTEAEVETLKDSFTGANEDFVTRTNVVYTLDEAKQAGIIAAYHVENGEYQYVYLKAGSGSYAFDNLLSTISMRGPVDGFYLNTGKLTVARGKTKDALFLTYDGSTAVQGTTTPIEANICFYNGTKSATGVIKFVIADTSASASVAEKLETIKNILNNYRDTDFIADDTLTKATAAIENALKVNAMPLTPTSAVQLQDKTSRQFVTAIEANEAGDVAYTPVTNISDIPVDMRANVYYNSSNGVYYADKEFVAPIYSSARLTSAGVTNGKDAAGMAVILVDGVYYHANTASYEKEWSNDGTYNYVDTDVQATNDNGELLYNQVQFKHYNANGKEVRNNDNWVVTAPETSFQIVKDGNDNRGLYSKANDYLQWTIEYAYSQIDPTIAARLFNEVSKVRNGMNSFNFDVVTYNKMVDLAKTIESQYSITLTYDAKEAVIDADGNTSVDAEGNVVTQTVEKTDTISFGSYNSYANNKDITIKSTKVTSNLSSAQVDEYVRLFSFYMSKVVERGYNGTQLENEIVCASGNAYSAYTVTVPTYDDDDKLVTNGQVNSTTATAKFGKFVDGVLVNQDADGNQAYTEESWNNYVNALAEAVAVAQLGNGSYAHKDKAYYNAAAGDYDANIDICYWRDSLLQKAEIALTPYEPEQPPVGDTHNVSGNILIATDGKGSTDNKAAFGEYTITVYSDAAKTTVVDTFKSTCDTTVPAERTNTFSFDLPDGTYYATVEYNYALTREIQIVVNGADVTGDIVVLNCDFDEDDMISALDAREVLTHVTDDNYMFMDIDGDGMVSALDARVLLTLVTATYDTFQPLTIQ